MIIRYGVSGILLFLLSVFSVKTSMGQSGLGKIKCVCIDAGHGGKDVGAVGAKTYEKHIVLSVALKLGKLIEQAYPDIKVVYIRKKDVFVELKERTRTANSHKADLFISVHANSLDVKRNPRSKYVKGIETYVLGSNSTRHNLEVAMKENAVIHYEDGYDLKYEGFEPSRPESYIMFSMLQNLHLDKSLTLASYIQKELVETTRQADREVRQGPLWVLKDVAMPSVLVEVGYISNPEEERYMMSSAGQEKIARGIFQGFRAYKARVEKRPAEIPVIAGEEQTVPAEKTASPGGKPFYAVQIASSAARIKNYAGLFPGREVVEMRTGRLFRYYVRPSEDLEKVRGSLKEVRAKVKDAWIIAIYNNKVISVAEARELEKKGN